MTLLQIEQLVYQLAFQSRMAPEVYCYEIVEGLIFCCVIMVLAGFSVLEKQSLKKNFFLINPWCHSP